MATAGEIAWFRKQWPDALGHTIEEMLDLGLIQVGDELNYDQARLRLAQDRQTKRSGESE